MRMNIHLLQLQFFCLILVFSPYAVADNIQAPNLFQKKQQEEAEKKYLAIQEQNAKVIREKNESIARMITEACKYDPNPQKCALDFFLKFQQIEQQRPEVEASRRAAEAAERNAVQNFIHNNVRGNNIQNDAYGYGIHMDEYGRPVQLQDQQGNVLSPDTRIKEENAYGPDLHMDQYGRPVTAKPKY